MTRRYVDLSMTLENDIVSDPPFLKPTITYETHAETKHELGHWFDPEEAEGMHGGQPFCAAEWVKLTTHSGTHVDAPWHYHPTQDAMLPGGSRPAQTIDQMPLEWFFNPGVKLDFRDKPNGYVVNAQDVEDELKRIGHILQPLDIVLVKSGAVYGTDNFTDQGCGMGAEATLYLTERGVKVVGTDAWSWDAPFSHTAKRWAETRDPSIIWEGHKAGRDIGYCHLEKLHNLEALPGDGFTISCFPHKIKGASAGWTRAVAIFED